MVKDLWSQGDGDMRNFFKSPSAQAPAPVPATGDSKSNDNVVLPQAITTETVKNKRKRGFCIDDSSEDEAYTPNTTSKSKDSVVLPDRTQVKTAIGSSRDSAICIDDSSENEVHVPDSNSKKNDNVVVPDLTKVKSTKRSRRKRAARIDESSEDEVGKPINRRRSVPTVATPIHFGDEMSHNEQLVCNVDLVQNDHVVMEDVQSRVVFHSLDDYEPLVDHMWHALETSPGKNPLFTQIFHDRETLLAICQAIGPRFPAQVFEAIQSDSAPDTSFFESLPGEEDVDTALIWAVYDMVLKKRGHIDLLYSGSGTNAKGGLRARWMAHKQGLKSHSMPYKVMKALEKGYKITSKGIYACIPLPDPSNVPIYRLFMVALEATFSFLFWTMESIEKDYKIGSCCLWPRSEFTYGGLNGHDALSEKVDGDFDLTTEQLMEKAAIIKKRRQENQKVYVRQRWDHFQEANRQWRARAVKEKRFYCQLCKSALDSPAHLTRHIEGDKHKQNLARATASIKTAFSCELCAYHTDVLFNYERHLVLGRHRRNLEKAAAEAEAKA